MISYQSLPSIATAMNDTYNTILAIVNNNNAMLAMYFPIIRMYIVLTVNPLAPLDIKNSIISE